MELKAKKSLGQNFLNSPVALQNIIEAADLKMGEVVLEIGPGTGILTAALLEKKVNVIAIEKDDRAFALLQEKFASAIKDGILNLIHGDILEISRDKIGLENGKYALVANIPYYITGMILESFLEYIPRPNKMVLLVQKEVAERIVARDGKESILSLSVKAFGQPTLVAKVPRGAFVPAPNVDSAILKIEGVSDSRFVEKGLKIRRFFEVLKAGFAHKRKYLMSNLKEMIPPEILASKWKDLGLDEKVRAEDLGLEKWLALAE